MIGTLSGKAEGEDIVWTAWQHAAVHKRTDKVLRALLNKSRAMASYGICVGVLGALRASGIPFFEVTPNEVKLASVGSKTASKAEMINWAVNLHPEAGWPVNSKGQITATSSEHMADAIATIYAGIKTQPFQQILPFLNQTPNQT